jgi:ACT domain-containing protein
VITEEEIRKLALAAIEELGKEATPQVVKKIVEQAASKIDKKSSGLPKEEGPSGRIILTSFGTNHPGIVAAITKTFSDFNCDIQDISQKILGDFYTMIMIVDISNSSKDLKELQEEMNKIGEEMKIKNYLQHEDVFRFMHRL